MTNDNSPRDETTDPLANVDWSDGRAYALRSFLEAHKLSMLHCDEELRPPYDLCECMERLACWWVENSIATRSSESPQESDATARGAGSRHRSPGTVDQCIAWLRANVSGRGGVFPETDRRHRDAADHLERLAGEVERYRFALEYIRVCADPKAVPKLANDALCISGHEWDSGAHPYCLNCGIPKGEGSS